MDTKELKCFACVYEEKSINKAARKLYITPQGLSKMIRNLEQELNTVLFKRTNQGMIPTESAMLFYIRSAELIHQFDCVTEEMHQITNKKQILRIGCAFGVFHVLPINVLHSFMQSNPDIQVEWSEYSNEEVKKKLRDSEIEYGFMVGKDNGEELMQKKLISQKIELLVYEGHPLYKRRLVSIDMLKNENILLMNERFQMHHEFIEACQAKGFYPSITATTSEGAVLALLCRQKAGLAVVTEFTTREINMNHLRAIPFEEMKTWDVYGSFLCDNQDFETIQRFRHYMTQYIGKKRL